jgi:hypothetical protein
LIAVQIRLGPAIELGARQVLFDVSANAEQFDESADGQQFLTAKPVVASTAQQPLMGVMNWRAP